MHIFFKQTTQRSQKTKQFESGSEDHLLRISGLYTTLETGQVCLKKNEKDINRHLMIRNYQCFIDMLNKFVWKVSQREYPYFLYSGINYLVSFERRVVLSLKGVKAIGEKIQMEGNTSSTLEARAITDYNPSTVLRKRKEKIAQLQREFEHGSIIFTNIISFIPRFYWQV